MISNNTDNNVKMLRERMTQFYNRNHRELMNNIKEERVNISIRLSLIIFLLCVIGFIDSYVVGIGLAQALGLLTSREQPLLLFNLIPVTAVIGFFIAILLVEAWSLYFVKVESDEMLQLPEHQRSSHRLWLLAALTLAILIAVIEGTSIYGFRMFQSPTIELLFSISIPLIFLIARLIVAYHQAKWLLQIRQSNKNIKHFKIQAREIVDRYDRLLSEIELNPAQYSRVDLEKMISFIKGEIELKEIFESAKPVQAEQPNVTTKQDTKNKEKPPDQEPPPDAPSSGGNQIRYIHISDTRPPSPYSGSPYNNNGFTRSYILVSLISVFLAFSLFSYGCVKSQDPDSIHLIVAYDASLSMAQDQELQCLNNFIGKTGNNLDSHLRITFIIFGAKPMILFSDLAGKKFSAAESTILSMLHKQPRSWKEKTDLVAAIQAVNTEINLEQSENQNKYIYTSLFVITDGKDDPNNTNPVIIPEQRLQDIARLLTQISGKVNKIIIFQIDPNVLLQYQPYVNNLFSAGKLVTEAQNPGDDLCKQLDLPEVWNVPRIHY